MLDLNNPAVCANLDRRFEQQDRASANRDRRYQEAKAEWESECERVKKECKFPNYVIYSADENAGDTLVEKFGADRAWKLIDSCRAEYYAFATASIIDDLGDFSGLTEDYPE